MTGQDRNAYTLVGQVSALSEMAAIYDADFIVQSLREVVSEYWTAEAERKAREQVSADAEKGPGHLPQPHIAPGPSSEDGARS
jgi:hypothetical protein